MTASTPEPAIRNQVHRVPARRLIAPVTLAGPGLFSPLAVRLTLTDHRHLEAATAAHGVVFQRTDAPGAPLIPADVRHVAGGLRSGSVGRNTVLRLEHGPSVSTTEHLLSAAYALSLWSLLCGLDGGEVPMLDGSASRFFDALAGASELTPGHGSPPPLVIRGPLKVAEGSAWIEAGPLNPARHPPRALVIDYELDYGQAAEGATLLGAPLLGAPLLGAPLLGGQGPRRASLTLNWDDPVGTALRFQREIAPARTFCTLAEAESFKQAGHFAHVDTQHVLVLGPDALHPGGIASGGPLRVPDEPARHKVLDAIGDLALVGRPIIGHVRAVRSGHTLNHAMARLMLDAFGA